MDKLGTKDSLHKLDKDIILDLLLVHVKTKTKDEL